MNKIFGIILVVIAVVMFCFGEYLVINDSKYKVNFTNTDNDFVVEVPRSGYIKKPQDPVKSGSTFIGWYYNDVKFNFNSKINSDLTLVAKWSESNGEDLDNNSTLSSSLWDLFKNKFIKNGF